MRNRVSVFSCRKFSEEVIEKDAEGEEDFTESDLNDLTNGDKTGIIISLDGNDDFK